LPRPWGAFTGAVEALLEAEAAAAEAEALPSAARPGAAERRALSGKVRRYAEQAEALKPQVLQHITDMGEAALEVLPADAALFVRAQTLRRLGTEVRLDECLVLLADCGELRQGWQLLGGLALAGAAPRAEPVPPGVQVAALELLHSLADALDAVWLAFRVPALHHVAHFSLQLDAWRSRSAIAEEEQRAAARWKAREHLEVSTAREQGRFAARGSSGPPALRPAHLERRVHWSEYRDCERSLRSLQRRALSAARRRHSCAASLARARAGASPAETRAPAPAAGAIPPRPEAIPQPAPRMQAQLGARRAISAVRLG